MAPGNEIHGENKHWRFKCSVLLLTIHWIKSCPDLSKEFNAFIFRLNSPSPLPFRLLDPEDEDTILRNAGVYLPVDTAQHKKEIDFTHHVKIIYYYAHSWNMLLKSVHISHEEMAHRSQFKCLLLDTGRTDSSSLKCLRLKTAFLLSQVQCVYMTIGVLKKKSACRVKKPNLIHNLWRFRQPLRVSGISRPIIWRYNCMYTATGTILFRWLSRTTDSHVKRIISTNCCIHQSCASSGDSELGRVSSGWITSPSLSKFGGS